MAGSSPYSDANASASAAHAGLATNSRRPTGAATAAIRAVGASLLALCALCAWGLFVAGPPRCMYMSLILGWGLPVLALQWGFGGHVTCREHMLIFNGLGVPTVFLWVADALAIEMEIWSINPAYLLGIYVGKLPVEEMTFFVVTNLMVLQGSLLFVRVAERMDAHDGKKGSQRDASAKSLCSRIWHAALRL